MHICYRIIQYTYIILEARGIIHMLHIPTMHTPPTNTSRFLGLHAQYNIYKSPFCLRFAVSLCAYIICKCVCVCNNEVIGQGR